MQGLNKFELYLDLDNDTSNVVELVPAAAVQGLSALPDGCPEPPETLSAYGKFEWMRVAPELFQQDRLTPAIMGIFEQYCQMIGTVREIDELLRQEGLLIRTERGSFKRHPATTLLTDALRELRLLALALGLTSVARNRKESNWESGLLA